MPQYLLEKEISEGKGAEVNILVTQPRRISATSLAARVAEEREENVGNVIGYTIKNQSCLSKYTRIVYCTAGINLILTND